MDRMGTDRMGTDPVPGMDRMGTDRVGTDPVPGVKISVRNRSAPSVWLEEVFAETLLVDEGEFSLYLAEFARFVLESDDEPFLDALPVVVEGGLLEFFHVCAFHFDVPTMFL